MTSKQMRQIISLHSQVVALAQESPTSEHQELLAKSTQMVGWAMDFVEGKPTPPTALVQEAIDYVVQQLEKGRSAKD